jgi:hypothetical protein
VTFRIYTLKLPEINYLVEKTMFSCGESLVRQECILVNLSTHAAAASHRSFLKCVRWQTGEQANHIELARVAK